MVYYAVITMVNQCNFEAVVIVVSGVIAECRPMVVVVGFASTSSSFLLLGKLCLSPHADYFDYKLK